MRGEIGGENRPRQVPGACYSAVAPTAVRGPRLLAWSDDLAELLGLTRPGERGPGTDVLAGNRVTASMKPFAARYGGHQFGSWAGQLGDGRAISLGELTARDGSTWEIQLKGAGPTPYSRRGDGRAVLRSSLREFLCSEAMHHLGVPTTRALSLVATGEPVVRDMFYDGHPREEAGAIATRVAPTFVRFGNFEILADRGELDNLRDLAGYVLRHHHPELGPPSEETYYRWFEEICRRTAVMIAGWMTVGFVHGVMNTDNMSILGLTIDYGPYGWLEPFDPGWTPNTTDFGQRRYAYGNQPRVAEWNLAMLAGALSPLVPDVEGFRAGLETYLATFREAYLGTMRKKLGLTPIDPADATLIDDLPGCLAGSQVDLTLFFRTLSDAAPGLLPDGVHAEPSLRALIAETSYAPADSTEHDALLGWLGRYLRRLREESATAEALRHGMRRANPKYVLRNYLAQNAIDAADAGDLAYLETLMKVLRRPFDEHPGHEDLARKRPDWARTRPGCATLSCSS